MQLRFASGSLKQYIHVEYEKKFPETDSVKADNPETILYEFIPPSYSTLAPEFAKIVAQDAQDFKPLGTKIGAYKKRYQVINGKGKGKASSKIAVEKAFEVVKDEAMEEEVVFEAYSSNWDTPGFKEFHRRMQIFVLLYIEGAQYIDEEDGRWEFVTLFVIVLVFSSAILMELTDSSDGKWGADSRIISWDLCRSTRSSAGLTRSDCDWRTSIPARANSSNLLCNLVNSSFCRLIKAKGTDVSPAPPSTTYRADSVRAASLYSLCYRNILSRPEISELTGSSSFSRSSTFTDVCDTVEDPSEPFEDMRDKSDLSTLLSGGDLEEMSAPLDRVVTEQIRKKYKLADVSFPLANAERN